MHRRGSGISGFRRPAATGRPAGGLGTSDGPMMAGVAPAFERAPNHRPPCWRPARGIKRNTDMADVRTARRNAEKAAGRHAGGAAGELGVARANRQEATAVVDVAAEKGRQLVE